MNIELYIHFWISVFILFSRYPDVKLLDPIVIIFLTFWGNSIPFSTVYSSIQFSRSVVSDYLRPYGLQHTRLPCLSPAPRACSNSCPLSWWCHPTISSSVIPFFSCLQSFPASGSFPVSQFFASGGQSINISASASVLPMNIQDWFPFGIDWLDLLAVQGTRKSLLQHHNSKASILQCSAFFVVQLSHPYVTTGKTIALTIQTFVSKVMFLLFSLSIMILKFIHGEACISTSFLFMTEQYSSIWTSHILFVYSSVDRHLGYFKFMTIVSSASLNIHL